MSDLTPTPDEPPPWRFVTLQAWMQHWFVPVVFRHEADSIRWCPEWWRHRFAVERLRTLWVAWEMMYPDPESSSSWWTYHFDAHWPELTKESGPFRDCTRGHVESTVSLTHVDPPDDWPLPRLHGA